MSKIEIENLTREFSNGKGIFDISFEIKEGEVFGFLGPNGAGKTTTIRHLMGFVNSQNGSCRISGLSCWDNRDEIQKSLGYIAGELSLFDDMTGIEYLKFAADYRGLKDTKKRDELIKYFELDPKSKIKKMSKGTKQKISIVSALMHNPNILILDEPTSGLDPLMQNKFIELIKTEKQKGKTILMSSHMFEEVERTADRICIIKDGRIVALDTTENLRRQYVKPYTVSLPDKKTAAEFAKDFGGIQDGLKVTVSTKQSLEEIFLKFYEKEGTK